MTDPADVLDQWLKDHEQEVPRSWGRTIPFEGESVPGSDAAGNDAEVMSEGEWLGCWRLDWATGELVAAA